MKTLITLSYILFVVVAVQADAFAISCSDSEHLTSKVITLKSQKLSRFSVTLKELKDSGLIVEGEKAIKINLSFETPTTEEVTFTKSMKSVKGYKDSYETSLFADSDALCVRLTSYMAGHKYERDLVSVNISKPSQDKYIKKATLYVTKRLSQETLRDYFKIEDERIRMNGLCFPGACVEYISADPTTNRFALRNDSLDNIKTLRLGIMLKCYENEIATEDEEPVSIDVPSTKRLHIERGETIYFENLCPANTKRMSVAPQIRGYNSSIALDGWVSLWGQK